MIAIVVSRADPASEHVGDRLLELAEWTEHADETRPDADGGGTYYRREGFELRTFDDLHIDMDDPTPAFGRDGRPGREMVDLLAFVSRHSGETGPLLTAHFTGNFGPAEYGGSDGAFAPAAPAAQKRLVEAFARHAPDGYDVGIECTHHGPTGTAVPSIFVELGSTEPQWEDPDGARAVARAVLELEGIGPTVNGNSADGGEVLPSSRHVVGFGGGHYAPRFERIVRETAWGVGHVGSDWQLAELGAPDANRDVLDRAFAASDADFAVVDGDRSELVETIQELGYRVVSETWIREVGDRPLALVEQLEAEFTPVEDGLRFGNRDVTTGPDGFAPIDDLLVRLLPAELLSTAQGVDREATRSAVERSTVAFETEEAGTRAAGEAVFRAADDYDRLVSKLADVLADRYDTVVVEDGAVVARETAFDPALAAEHGVPEGPKFGQLAAGEAVEVDGETIAPDDVRRSREQCFPI